MTEKLEAEVKALRETNNRLAAEQKRQSHVITTLKKENSDIVRQNKHIHTQNTDLNKRLLRLVAEFDDFRNRQINTEGKVTSLERRHEGLLDRFNKLAQKLLEKFNL